MGLARPLVSSPELLVLDEPTNHLYLAAMTSLEGRGRNYPDAALFVTYDPRCLQAVSPQALGNTMIGPFQS